MSLNRDNREKPRTRMPPDWLKLAGLVVIVVASASLLVWGQAPAILNVAAQVGSALAGAAFGVVITRKSADDTTRSHSRPAVRQLLDQITRLQVAVINAESRAQLMRSDDFVDRRRIADWFEDTGQALRNEIGASGSAIQNWADLAPDIHTDEIAKYAAREDTKSTGNSKEFDGD